MIVKKGLLWIILGAVLLVSTACLGSRGEEVAEIVRGQVESTSYAVRTTAVTISPGTVLPPYGVTVQAERLILSLRLEATQIDPAQRLTEINAALDTLETALSVSETISLLGVEANQIESDSERRVTSEESYTVQVGPSVVTVKLVTPFSAHNNSQLEALAAFDALLETLTLPDGVDLEPFNLQPEVPPVEGYRQQIIRQVYSELAAIQTEYGPEMQFEAIGLHAPLQIMRLSDSQLYLYLTPEITVREF